MKKFLKYYDNPEESRFNFGLMNRVYDRPLPEYIDDCCKSLEVLEAIKFTGSELIVNESDINTSEYITQRARGKKDVKTSKYMYLHDSRCAEMRLHFNLSINNESEDIVKKILIPMPDDNGYYTIKGNKYFLLWQIVDNSTYTTKSSLTLKSMMPVIIKLNHYTAKSTNGESYNAPIYTINIFKKDMDIMSFYLANGGIDWTLKYFSVDRIMNITTSVVDEDKYIYFQIHSKMYLEINKLFFLKYTYVKSIAFMLLKIMSNRITPDDLFDTDYWIDYIGSLGTTNKNSQREKGLKTMTFFNRIIDSTTKKILKTHKINSTSIYSIIRWLIQNFEDLRRKDNLSLQNKRLRCNEYIASLLTKIFSERINRIIAMGSKATMKNLKEIFRFSGDIILSQLHSSGLKSYESQYSNVL